MPSKREIADALDEIARLVELSGDTAFKARAFSKAARVVRDLEGDIEKLARAGKLEETAGIGRATGEVIREILATGHSQKLDSLRAAIPATLVDIMRMPGVGPRHVALLHRKLGVTSLDELEDLVAQGRIRDVPELGPRMESRIAEALRTRRSTRGRVLLSRAFTTAEALARRLAEIAGVERSTVSGQVRRRCEIVDEITIVAVADDGIDDLAASVSSMDLGIAIEASSTRRLAGRTDEGTPVEVLFVEPARFAITLFVTTGSPEFVARVVGHAESRGLVLTVDGLRRGARLLALEDEDSLFSMLGLPAVPPELREDPRSLDRAPASFDLVETADLRGTFHIHSTWSDGRATLREMLASAQSLGLTYAGVSDHSKSAVYARGLDELRLSQQRVEVERLRAEFPAMRVFWGIESDILADGDLDYDSTTLAGFDFVIASVHSRFKMPRAEMTERIVRAIRNPFTTFIGHLTGRMLLGREGCHIDYEPIFAASAEHGVIIEINGSPRRLDLDWRRMREAVDRGVILSIHPDAHDVGELGNLMSGTWAARKGGLGPSEVFNTREVGEVAAWLEKRRTAARG